MSRRLKFLLLERLVERRTHSSSQSTDKGFTLTELLVVVIIGSLIVSSLMALVVQLVGTEQRESAKTETQREMQLALDYIVSDLRQAVYVYDGQPRQSTVRDVNGTQVWDFLPRNLTQDGATPVLAFWKPTPFDPESVAGLPAYNADPDSRAGCRALNEARRRECNNLWLQRRTYSLIVYAQVQNDEDPNNNGQWEGRSRIVRYELAKYSDMANFARNQGYVDPAEIGATGFAAWPFRENVNCQATACEGAPGAAGRIQNQGASRTTLVDFVDSSDNPPDDARPVSQAQCPGFDPALPADEQQYLMTPPNPRNARTPAFFACIRNVTGNVDAAGVGATQDIYLYLRGNVSGRSGIYGANSDVPLPAMQTRLTMRGVIDKEP